MTTVQTHVPVAEIELRSGARLIHQFIPGAPRLAIAAYLPGGNRLEPVFGLADMIDRLLLKGTATRNQEQIALEIDSLTLEMDSDTKRDYTAMYATLLEEDLDASLELMADCLFRSTFDEFEREKEKVAGEIQMDLDSPRARSSDQFVRTLFPDSPYGVVGSVLLEGLDKLGSVESLKAYYRQAYRPERLIFSTAGDIPQDTMVAALEKYFPACTDTVEPIIDKRAADLRQHSIIKDTLVQFGRDDSNQAHLFKGWIMPPLIHADYYPLVVLNTILGGAGLSSRLFVELRDKQGLAYNVRSSFEALMHCGVFSLYIGTEPSNKQKCLDGFIVECQKLMDKAVSEQELAEAKQNILGRRNVYLETASQLASYVGSSYLMGRSLDDIRRAPEFIQAVTSADIQRVAQTYLSRPAVTSVVAPTKFL